MFTISEMIVLLWLVPLALNILLPLAVLFFWIIIKPFKLLTRRQMTDEDQISNTGQALSSTAS